jgi:hypothetical protein
MSGLADSVELVATKLAAPVDASSAWSDPAVVAAVPPVTSRLLLGRRAA